jgi:hypothetical protein
MTCLFDPQVLSIEAAQGRVRLFTTLPSLLQRRLSPQRH